MIGMTGMRKGPNHCVDCRHYTTGTGYGKAVCYEFQRINGQKVATRIKPTRAACAAFRTREA